MFPLLDSLASPFRRIRIGGKGRASSGQPTPTGLRLLAAPITPAPPPILMSSDPTLPAKVLAAMLDVLDNYLPPNSVLNPPLPDPSLSLVSVTERTVGLGSRVGTDIRGPFNVSALKGTRLEAVVRYQLWSDTPSGVDAAIQDLATRLLADRDVLRAAGFLRFSLKTSGASENVPSVDNRWRESVDFEALYEFPYVDSDDADSLIARIPIKIEGELTESFAVTDEMVRWDDEPSPPPPDPPSAPPLLLRGPLSIRQLSAMSFIPGTAPTGTVTLTRTFDGAAGPTPVHPDLTTFLAAVTDPVNPAREGQLVFASLSDFLAAFNPFGDAITLGDWDEDLTADEFESLALTISPPIKLPNVADRFEISYETPEFDQVAVVYLRATR